MKNQHVLTAVLLLLLVAGAAAAAIVLNHGTSEPAPGDPAAGLASSSEAAEAEAPLRIAVTVDDLPVAQPSWHTTAQMRQITGALLATLGRHGIKATGFVNEVKLEVDGRVDQARVDLLRQWLDAGQELGNHGYAHLDLHRVEPDIWMADILRGERTIRPLLEAAGGHLRWFRHPYLHVGRSLEVQQQTAAFLSEHGYTVAPVSIDNSEWVYGAAYADAFNTGDADQMQRLGTDYVRYMLDVVAYYQAQSKAILHRPLAHILLIHAYALNADHLDHLLNELEHRGARWITLADALEDPAYTRPIDGFTGMGGITWLHRWALTEGLDHSIFVGEPEVPDWVRELGR